MAATTPGQINRILAITVKHGLRAEIRGMRLTNRGPSSLTVARREGWTTARTAREAYEDVCALLAVPTE